MSFPPRRVVLTHRGHCRSYESVHWIGGSKEAKRNIGPRLSTASNLTGYWERNASNAQKLPEWTIPPIQTPLLASLRAGLRLSRAKLQSAPPLAPSIHGSKASDSKAAGRSVHKCLGMRLERDPGRQSRFFGLWPNRCGTHV